MVNTAVIANAIREAFGVREKGASFLEYIAMSLGGAASNGTPSTSVPQALCNAASIIADSNNNIADAIKDLARAIKNRE